jgi:hypothetical protein
MSYIVTSIKNPARSQHTLCLTEPSAKNRIPWWRNAGEIHACGNNGCEQDHTPYRQMETPFQGPDSVHSRKTLLFQSDGGWKSRTNPRDGSHMLPSIS